METWKKNLAVLWLGTLIVSASFSMVVPFLPLFLLQIGVHHGVELWSGIIYSIAFLTGAISSPYWGSVADRYGRKPMIVRAGFVLFALYTLTAFVHNPYELLMMRTLQGLLTGFIPGAIALVGTNTPEDKVGYALAMVSGASASGGIVGPLLGGIIARWTTNRVAFATAGVLVLFATIFVIIWVREDKFTPSATRSSIFGAFQEALHNRPLLFALFLNMFTALSIMTIEPVLTLYIAELGHNIRNASFLSGLVFSLTGVASVVFSPIWGKTADGIGFYKVLLIGLAGGTLFSLLQLPFHNIFAFSVVRFVYGAFFSAVFPAINGLVVKATASSFRGRAFGLNQTANQVGQMAGPLIGGAVAGVSSIHGVFWVTGSLLAAVTLITVAKPPTALKSPGLSNSLNGHSESR